MMEESAVDSKLACVKCDLEFTSWICYEIHHTRHAVSYTMDSNPRIRLLRLQLPVSLPTCASQPLMDAEKETVTVTIEEPVVVKSEPLVAQCSLEISEIVNNNSLETLHCPQPVVDPQPEKPGTPPHIRASTTTSLSTENSNCEASVGTIRPKPLSHLVNSSTLVTQVGHGSVPMPSNIQSLSFANHDNVEGIRGLREGERDNSDAFPTLSVRPYVPPPLYQPNSSNTSMNSRVATSQQSELFRHRQVNNIYEPQHPVRNGILEYSAPRFHETRPSLGESSTGSSLAAPQSVTLHPVTSSNPNISNMSLCLTTNQQGPTQVTQTHSVHQLHYPVTNVTLRPPTASCREVNRTLVGGSPAFKTSSSFTTPQNIRNSLPGPTHHPVSITTSRGTFSTSHATSSHAICNGHIRTASQTSPVVTIPRSTLSSLSYNYPLATSSSPYSNLPGTQQITSSTLPAAHQQAISSVFSVTPQELGSSQRTKRHLHSSNTEVPAKISHSNRPNPTKPSAGSSQPPDKNGEPARPQACSATAAAVCPVVEQEESCEGLRNPLPLPSGTNYLPSIDRGSGKDLAIPVVDVSSKQTVSRLKSMGITHFIPLSSTSTKTEGLLALPLIIPDVDNAVFGNGHTSGYISLGSARSFEG